MAPGLQGSTTVDFLQKSNKWIQHNNASTAHLQTLKESKVYCKKCWFGSSFFQKITAKFSKKCIFILFYCSFCVPQDGLVKSDMEKLTFYAVSAPEKLDRIGAYLAERLSRDVVRHRYG